jgi:hypothetical protein
MAKETQPRGDARGSRRRRWIALAALAIVIVVAGVGGYLAFGRGSSLPPKAATAPTAHVYLAPECQPVTGRAWRFPGPARIESTRYELFAISYSCSEAGTWARQLSKLQVPLQHSGALSVIKGPAGFLCAALPDATGHAYSGGCQKGKVAFGWNWNVANSRRALVHDPTTGQLRAVNLSGQDAETIIRPLTKGHYRVSVLNTSGIGFLNGFTWSPPPGWTIKSITKTTGAKCKLDSDGKVSCSGKVVPPSCLCKADGGTVTVDLAVSVHTAPLSKGKITGFGAVGAKLRITAMTPVPYLIPGTPAEAKRQHGV